MNRRTNPPSPDNGVTEQLLRSQVGRLITDLFHSWDDPYKSPELMREDGQEAIARFHNLVTDAAIRRNLIPDLVHPNPNGSKE